MHIGTPEEFIEIERSRLTLKTLSLSGTTSFDLNETNIDQFIDDLKQLEKTRQGTAELKHLSHKSEFRPFHLKIFSIDRLGHIAVQAEINRTHYIHNVPYRNSLSIVIELDVEKFAIMTKEFISLAKQKSW